MLNLINHYPVEFQRTQKEKSYEDAQEQEINTQNYKSP
jgi:hypothetical protein